MKLALIVVSTIASLVLLACLLTWALGKVSDRADAVIDKTLGHRDEHEDGFL